MNFCIKIAKKAQTKTDLIRKLKKIYNRMTIKQPNAFKTYTEKKKFYGLSSVEGQLKNR